MLSSVPFFSGLAPAQLKSLEEAGRVEARPKGNVIFAEGDPGESLYVILEGRVTISREEEGRRLDLSQLAAGDFFGELALFDGAPRSATATVEDDSQLFVLARDAFLDSLAASPEMLTHILSGVSSRMRGVNEKFLVEIVEKERVRAEMEKERYRSLAQLVAGVAHEINTPLGIVNTAASIISEAVESLRSQADLATVTADLEEAAMLIQGNLARANKLVQSFKNLSVAQVTDQREECDLAAVVAEIVTLFTPQARRARLDVIVSAQNPPMPWNGYPGYLAQIVMNLLANVERYAYPEGGGRVEVVTRREGHDSYVLQVRDFGAGMSAEDRARAFEPFFTTGRARGGTGLGMAIVHNLATTALRGSIEIDSAEGSGTTVTLTIPRAVPE